MSMHQRLMKTCARIQARANIAITPADLSRDFPMIRNLKRRHGATADDAVEAYRKMWRQINRAIALLAEESPGHKQFRWQHGALMPTDAAVYVPVYMERVTPERGGLRDPLKAIIDRLAWSRERFPATTDFVLLSPRGYPSPLSDAMRIGPAQIFDANAKWVCSFPGKASSW